MTALMIDTSTNRGLVGITEGNNLISSCVFPAASALSNRLLPTIVSLLEQSHLCPASLNYIAVGIGPGSYTGTRVGVSVARTLAFALNLPLVNFCSLLAFLPRETGRFASVMEAKMENVFLIKGIKSDEGLILDPPIGLIPSASLERYLTDVDILVAEQTEPHLEGLAPFLYKKFLAQEFSSQESEEIIYLHTPA